MKNEKYQLLNEQQKKAFEQLKSPDNVFLTGAAGSGKSFLIQTYVENSIVKVPIVASTGAAAVLVGGCTFHSFFGLGIMKGGLDKTIERALKDKRLQDRLRSNNEIIIDEISMIDPEAFYAADQISRRVRGQDLPFGGLRVIAVGDFFQLPPVHKGAYKFWLFQTKTWASMGFKVINLTEIMRTSDQDFIEALNYIREGECPNHVDKFFSKELPDFEDNFNGTILFGHKAKVEKYNKKKLDNLEGDVKVYFSDVTIKKSSKLTHERVLSISPLPERLVLKPGALIMIRKNHPFGHYVNGTLAVIRYLHEERIIIKTLRGTEIEFEKESFEVLNADGKLEAVISNFPVSLAWATTIHKAQGASIDKVFVDLSGLWERGQAYVALSRAKNADGLFVKNWSPKYVKVDPRVKEFYDGFDVL